MSGRYLVIEGMDGSGKTTQRDFLADKLRKTDGQLVEVMSEPGGTPIGDEIRRILIDGELARSPETNLDLFMICRREIVAQKLAAIVTGGMTALSDRNWFSSVAYQGFAEGVRVEEIIKRAKNVMGDYFLPDRMVVIDVPVELAEERMRSRGSLEADYFDAMGRGFFEKVAQGYRWLAEEFDVPKINGNQSVKAVHTDIVSQLEPYLPKLRPAE